MFERPQQGERAVLVHVTFRHFSEQADLPEFRELARAVLLLTFPLVPQADEQPSAHWVQDPQHVLSQERYRHLGRLLQSTYQAGGVIIHLLVIDQPEQSLKIAALQQKARWEAQFPTLQEKSKVVYLAMNVATNDSLMFLGAQCRPTDSLLAGLQNIHQGILMPHLENNAIERACVESVVALITVFEDWAFMQQGPQSGASFDVMRILKWGSWLAILISFCYVFGDQLPGFERWTSRGKIIR